MDGAEKKFIALAQAIPEEKYSWRPGAGVRSVGPKAATIAEIAYARSNSVKPPWS